jgi:hypothetical protein
MAPVLQEVLDANETYSASFGDKGKLAMPPARRFAITPCVRPIERFGDVVAYPILGGLHHRCARI